MVSHCPTSVYYGIRLLYKRSIDGQILEAVGEDKEVATNILRNCLDIGEGPVKSRITQLDGQYFESTEFDLEDIPTETDFDTVRLCEMRWDSHVAGILTVLRGTHKKDLIHISKEKQTLRAILQKMQRPPLSRINLEQQNLVDANDFRFAYQNYEKAYHYLDDVQRAILRPTCDNPPILDIREYIALILLSQKWAVTPPYPLVADETLSAMPKLSQDEIEDFTEKYISEIRTLFEIHLLSQAPEDDQWSHPDPDKGRNLFTQKLRYFVSRRVPVQFCLPAFPCKSPNPRKTSSRFPDGSEYEALVKLHYFCAKVRELYRPGVALTIVSDGHVFSDCVGVDDDRVSEYTGLLKLMSDEIFTKNKAEPDSNTAAGDKDPICFLDLHDVFQPSPLIGQHFRETYLQEQLVQVLTTKVHPRDEICRQLMITSCGIDPMILGSVIETQPNHPLTAVYRGFARFMLDDLAATPDMQGKTKHRRKFLSQLVARSMISRNQAYSHLVELVKPLDIRLSIHAHKNCGPKFAITLFPKSNFFAVRSFQDVRSGLEERSHAAQDSLRRYLHIPTPWHNVLVEIEDHSNTYICKAGLVMEELEDDESPFCPKRSGYKLHHPRYGRFVLFLRYKDGHAPAPTSDGKTMKGKQGPGNAFDGCMEKETKSADLGAAALSDSPRFREQLERLRRGERNFGSGDLEIFVPPP